MLTYHTKKGLEEICNAINAYEIRSTKKTTKNIKDDTVVNLASGIVVNEGIVKSITVKLNLYSLTIERVTRCKQFNTAEIIIFEREKQLILFLCKTCKEQLLCDTDFGVDYYA